MLVILRGETKALIGSAMLLLVVVCSSSVAAQQIATQQTGPQPQTNGSIEADGTVNVPGFRLPPSAYLSPEARAALPRKATDMEAPMVQALAMGKAGQMRAKIGEYMAPQINHFAALYPTTWRDTIIGGVPAVEIKPVAPIPAMNAHKIMLNIPGGGFVMGTAHGTGMLESIPLAAMDKVRIVSITYRQGPEFKYPAASEDIVAVYRELLKTYKPQDIAIFGCSAGGLLTAEAMAWFQKEKLPIPSSIGIFCASADARIAGDSRYFNRPFQAIPPKEGGSSYFSAANLSDPLASPIVSPEILAHFPPTLIITATRAHELSSAVTTHRELVKVKVDAELHVWDGLGHDFFSNIDLPESREAFDVMADFFRKHLKLAR
jgi:monoterpene epsilon-lactone hydrolase